MVRKGIRRSGANLDNHSRLRTWTVALALAILTMAAFSALPGNGFINLDDEAYVTLNPVVKGGLSWQGVRWAFSATDINWHPLTWLSHMLDVELFGLDPIGHHVTSGLLHVANTIVLFLVLKSLTGTLWRSAFVAALFGIHPLHVESVAWVSERKDVLSTFFGLSALSCYLAYARRPRFSAYGLLMVLFGLSLLSKPMLVTLPCILLLMDYWPLGRLPLRKAGGARTFGAQAALLEKLPLFALSAACSWITLVSQEHSGGLLAAADFPAALRFGNAALSYLGYLGKIFWPTRLAVFYPYPDAVALAWVAVALLLATTLITLHGARRRPHLLFGWLWYLGTLIPVIGVVQVGGQSMADRYLYVPAIGIFILLAWIAADLAARGHLFRKLVPALAVGILATLAAVTWRQTRLWHDPISLFRHALAVTEDNWRAHASLGKALSRSGQSAEAIVHYIELVKLRPDFLRVHDELGLLLVKERRWREGEKHLVEAIRRDPGVPESRFNLALALEGQGRINEAATQLREALRLKPQFPEARANLEWISRAHKRPPE